MQAYAPADAEVSNILLSESELSPTGFPVVLLVDNAQAWPNLVAGVGNFGALRWVFIASCVACDGFGGT